MTVFIGNSFQNSSLSYGKAIYFSNLNNTNNFYSSYAKNFNLLAVKVFRFSFFSSSNSFVVLNQTFLNTIYVNSAFLAYLKIGFYCLESLVLDGISSAKGQKLFPSDQYLNYLSTFARLFGINAKQDTTKIYISKADLPNISPKTDNSTESLLVALLLRGLTYESNSLISKIVISEWSTEIINKNKSQVIQTILLIKLFRLLPVINYELQNPNEAITPSNI